MGHCKRHFWNYKIEVGFESMRKNFFFFWLIGCVSYVISFCEKFFIRNFFLAYKLCSMYEKYLWEFFFDLQVLFHLWEIFLVVFHTWEFFLAYKFCSICDKFFWLIGCVLCVRNFCEKLFWLISCVPCLRNLVKVVFLKSATLIQSYIYGGPSV